MHHEVLNRRRAGAGATAVLFSGALVAVLTLAGAGVTAATTTLATFDSHGTYKWTVPSGVYAVTFDVFGASGGNFISGNTILDGGGRGGEARARFSVKPGQVFEIVVGGRGGDNPAPSYSYPGFNGGGSGGPNGGGGGGGSDVRIGGKGNSCATTRSCDFHDRIIVGGGGGGAGALNDGANGGGLTGADAPSSGGRGGQQEDPYNIKTCPTRNYAGCFGWGGWNAVDPNAAGGGGGGWYGGDADGESYGGGGGSGFISFFAHKPSFPGGNRAGDGLVMIKS